MGYVSDEQRKASHASQAEAASKMLSPVSMFGSMGANPNINFLTNANALAAQQLAQQNVAPMQQPQVTPSMGIFGDADARNRSLYPSALMAHADKEVEELNATIMKIRKQYENEEKEGEFYEDPGYEAARARLAEIQKEHEKK
tara:strand:+ start:71 stop:499 length:429 start_codon:yes stop_codon:yes gene_type:complete